MYQTIPSPALMLYFNVEVNINIYFLIHIDMFYFRIILFLKMVSDYIIDPLT